MNIRCYKCGSKNVTVSVNTDQSYSVGKGLVGTVLFGTGGAAMGVNGKTSENKRFICQACGEVAGISMSKDICERLERELRENDESMLKITKRYYPNIEWEEPVEEKLDEEKLDEEELKRRFISFFKNSPNQTFDTKTLADYFNLDHDDFELWEILYDYERTGVIKMISDVNVSYGFYSTEEFSSMGYKAYGPMRRSLSMPKHLFITYKYCEDISEILENKKMYDQVIAQEFKWNSEHKDEIQKKEQEEKDERDAFLYQILEEHCEEGELYKVSDIIKMLPVEMTSSRVKASLIRLMNKDKVLNIIDKKISYYTVKESYYKKAVINFENAKKIEELENIKNIFNYLENYKDSQEYVSKCTQKIEKIYDEKRKNDYANACAKFSTAMTLPDFQNLSNVFKTFGDYEKSKEYFEKCIDQINIIQERINTIRQRQVNNLCQHCGGKFKGIFIKKCKACGKQKDY